MGRLENNFINKSIYGQVAGCLHAAWITMHHLKKVSLRFSKHIFKDTWWLYLRSLVQYGSFFVLIVTRIVAHMADTCW